MSKGIYQYTDLKTDEVVYVGKDSSIHRNQRHSDHQNPAMYNGQPFNRIIQNNPDRYKYEVVCEARHYSNVYLNCLEKGLIKVYNPKFNFTIGGDGSTGYKHSEESKRKMSEAHKGERNHFFNKHHTEESKQKIRDAVSGEKSCWFGVNRTDENKLNVSKSTNTTGYFRVCKVKRPKCKQGFLWEYKYYGDDKKRHTLTSTDINKLKEKVLAVGEIWHEFGGD